MGSRSRKVPAFWQSQNVSSGYALPHLWSSIITKLNGFVIDKNPGPDKPRPCCTWSPQGYLLCQLTNLTRRLVKVFDVLYIKLAGGAGGVVLTNKTLSVRLGVLKDESPEMRLFKPVPGRLEFATSRIGRSVEDVEEFLKEIVEER